MKFSVRLTGKVATADDTKLELNTSEMETLTPSVMVSDRVVLRVSDGETEWVTLGTEDKVVFRFSVRDIDELKETDDVKVVLMLSAGETEWVTFGVDDSVTDKLSDG